MAGRTDTSEDAAIRRLLAPRDAAPPDPPTYMAMLGAQQRQAMRQLAAALAHEANNALTGLVAGLEQLRATNSVGGGGDSGSNAAALAEAEAGATRVAALVRQIRPLADGDGRAMARVRLADVLDLAIMLGGEPLRRRAPVTVAGARDLCVRGHIGHMAQALLSVLTATCEALAQVPAPAGGHALLVACTQGDRTVQLAVCRRAGTAAGTTAARPSVARAPTSAPAGTAPAGTAPPASRSPALPTLALGRALLAEVGGGMDGPPMGGPWLTLWLPS